MDLSQFFQFLDQQKVERWTELQKTRDWSNIDPNIRYEINQIVKFIRTKGDGGDVRESIAQALEWVEGLTNKQILNEQQTQLLTNALRSKYDELESRYDVQVGALTEDAEILDAREGPVNLRTRLKLIDSKFLTPEMFGAVGDGVTDDSLAIQTALNSQDSNIILLSKEYLIKSAITVPEGKRVIGGIIYPQINIAVRVQNGSEINGLILDYSKFDNPVSNANGYHGIYFEGVNYDIKILNVLVKNFKTFNPNRFNAITSNRNAFDFKIDGLKVSNIRVRGNDIVGDEIGSVRAIYMGHEAYTKDNVPTLLRSGEISNIVMENINNISANDIVTFEDADGIYLSGYASDVMLPLAKSNVSIRNIIANSTGKRAIKLQTSGVHIDNVEANLTLPDTTTCAVMGYGNGLAIKNVRATGASRIFEGLLTDSYIENVSGDCQYGFYVYSSKNTVLNKIDIKSSNAPFFLNPTANSIYENYQGFTVQNSQFGYKHGLLAGTYYTDLNIIDGTFNFQNCKMVLLDGDFTLCYSRNIAIKDSEFVNRKVASASNLSFNYFYRGENHLKNINCRSETTIYPDIVLNRANNTKIVMENVKGINNYNGSLLYVAGNFAENIKVRDCDISQHTSANPIFVNLGSDGVGAKVVNFSNIILNDGASMRFGETTSTSLLDVSISNIKIRDDFQIDTSKVIATCVNKVSLLRTRNILNSISGLTSVATLISDGWDGLIYDTAKSPYKIAVSGTSLTKISL